MSQAATKTVMLFNKLEEGLDFYIFESGDYSRFEDIFINQYIDPEENRKEIEKLQEELNLLFWDKEGNRIAEPIARGEAFEAIRQGAKVVYCGMFQ